MVSRFIMQHIKLKKSTEIKKFTAKQIILIPDNLRNILKFNKKCSKQR